MVVAEEVRNMMKVELHLHLEGAIPVRTFLHLIQKYDQCNTEILTVEDLAKKLSFTDFTHFIECWAWMCTLLREPEDFEQLTYDVLADLHGQNVIYAEMFYSAGRYWVRDGKVQLFFGFG